MLNIFADVALEALNRSATSEKDENVFKFLQKSTTDK